MSLLFTLLLAAAEPPAVPEGEALTEAVAARDAEFFALFFEQCDPEAMRGFLTDDFEMYHDRDGVVVSTGAAMVEDYRGWCAGRQAPDAWRSRRELVRETLRVFPVPGFGAIEEGTHLFHERQGDGPERLVGRARFVQLWRLTDTGWRLSRVLSYDHGLAGENADAR
ncbi:MAG: nuclear transport factor 2 family protein [Sphingomonadaceae bacterium]|nr:nuclear transport factor 2 family protein [Sphingomonadaceae bacterium]